MRLLGRENVEVHLYVKILIFYKRRMLRFCYRSSIHLKDFDAFPLKQSHIGRAYFSGLRYFPKKLDWLSLSRKIMCVCVCVRQPKHTRTHIIFREKESQ